MRPLIPRVIATIRITSIRWWSYLPLPPPPPQNTAIGAHRPCVRCAAARIARLAFIHATFIPHGSAEWSARVDAFAERWRLAIGDCSHLRLRNLHPVMFRLFRVAMLDFYPVSFPLLFRDLGVAIFIQSCLKLRHVCPLQPQILRKLHLSLDKNEGVAFTGGSFRRGVRVPICVFGGVFWNRAQVGGGEQRLSRLPFGKLPFSFFPASEKIV